MADQTATDVSRTAVSTAIAACNATGGGTVTIPAGTANWLTAYDVTLTQNVAIIGAGIGNTIIVDALPNSAPNPQKVLSFTTTAGKTLRISGIEFSGQAGGRTQKYGQGCLFIGGGSNSVRVDHCHWGNTILNRYLYIGGAVLGVCDHCTCSNTDASQGIFYIDHSSLYVNASYGDGSWSNPTALGGADFFFFEDNNFVQTNSSFGPALTDGNGGDRIVLRNNTITRMNIQGHGTGSTGRTRGIRAAEIYNNTWIFNNGTSQATYIRSGTGVIWGNTCTLASTNSCFTFADFRQLEYIYSTWLGEDGSVAWDTNDTSNQTGNGYGGSTGGLYASGTAQFGSTSRTLVISGSGAISNWVGYAVVNLDQPQPGFIWTGATTSGSPIVTIPNLTMTSSFYLHESVSAIQIPAPAYVGQIDQVGPPAIFRLSSSPSTFVPVNATSTTSTASVTLRYPKMMATVLSNVGNTLTVTIAAHPATAQQTWAVGNRYEIRKVTQPLDGIGIGPGDYLGGGISPIPRNLNQSREPYYVWSNTNNGVHQDAIANVPNTRAGIDFINNGTTAKPGYVPFLYPHPLVSGQTGAVIVLTGTLAFGNIIIGNTGTATLVVSNTGDTILNVSAVSYPTGFTGLTTGFTVAAGASHNITVTFTPLLEQLYSGNITVTSDATSGVNTIACSGTGVAPTGGGGHGKGHKKGVLVGRGR